MRNLVILLTCIITVSAIITNKEEKKRFKYPDTRRESVIDNYHGTLIAAPYRWLEDYKSEEVVEWARKQNELTMSYIENIPLRKTIKDTITRLTNYERFTAPTKVGTRYFFFKNDGLQDQSVLYMQKTLEEKPVMVLDPNSFSSDGTTTLGALEFSHDGSHIAYGLSAGGSDVEDIKIMNIDTGNELEETLKEIRFPGIAWTKDNKGFYYNRYPYKGEVPEGEEMLYNKLFYHELGTDPSNDNLIYERPDKKEYGFWPYITDDGKYLILDVFDNSWSYSRVYYKDLSTDKDIVTLLDEGDALYSFAGNSGSIFYFHTTLDAPKGRIISIDINDPAREKWEEIIPEQEENLDQYAFINEKFLLAYLKDVHHVIRVYNASGKHEADVELPSLGSISGLSGEPDQTEAFFSFTSFLYPPAIFRYDVESNKLSLFKKPSLEFDFSQYTTKQVFYGSRDGTKVPMFLIHNKKIRLDSNNPVQLYAYGGFNVSVKPFFSTSVLTWLELGGVFAVANIRGGNEYGEEWHEGGMLANKQNVFDDFIAAAEWLIDNKYTSSSKLAIRGGSNGGLLTATCMIQRPELYGAVISQVPVIDMLRFHKFTAGRYWTGEYGNAEETPEHFRFLLEYSPLHNVRSGIVYPPTLVMTSDTDDRVVPLHSFKFVATLQYMDPGHNPLFLRYEQKEGHGGSSVTQYINTISDIYAFIFSTFEMNQGKEIETGFKK